VRLQAVRRDALDGLLDEVRDDGWFFHTELLVLAQRRGLRIHEVPVDWVDDPDSRVDIVRTAIDDLRRPAGRRLAGGALHGRRRRLDPAYALLYVLLHGMLRAGGGTPSHWPSPRWPTPRPTGG
jgi:hypothetical protein